MESLIGIGLAGGQGIRCRPLTLKANGIMRAKAAVRFLGRRIVDWLLAELSGQGIAEVLMVTKGEENHNQIHSLVGDGESLGVHIRYSPHHLDHENSGSGDALLTNLDYFDVTTPLAFVFPTDSILDFDLPAMLEAHRRSGAVVTIAVARQSAEVIAGQYGLIDQDAENRVRGFLEKPSLKDIYTHFAGRHHRDNELPPLLTNTGFYLIDTAALRNLSGDSQVAARRRRQLDIGGDLLPWLVAAQYPVYTHEVRRMGDLGNIPSYLATMATALQGHFPSVERWLLPDAFQQQRLFIDPTSLEMPDPISHRTLREKLALGLVKLRAPVRIGKYVIIHPGAVLSESNIDDECDIQEHAILHRTSVGEGSRIGPYSSLTDVVTGGIVEIQSTRQDPVTMSGFTAIGDGVVVQHGAMLHNQVTVFPRIRITAGVRVPARMEIQSPEQLYRLLPSREERGSIPQFCAYEPIGQLAMPS